MVLSPLGFAQQNTNFSNIFTLDTRTGVLIPGIVLDGSSPSGPFIPPPGASVTIGTSSTTSDSRGAFEIRTPLASAQTATSLDLGSITLRNDNKPVIQSVELTPDDSFWQTAACRLNSPSPSIGSRSLPFVSNFATDPARSLPAPQQTP
jgi:hypothetical protein